MTSVLWRYLRQCYGINIKFSSAHHLKTDGQTKDANKIMKNYLQAYISYIQDNQIDHLLMAEFAANNHMNALTGIKPFFADNSFHLYTGIEPPQAYQRSWKAELLTVDKIVANQKAMVTFLQDQLTWAQQEQAY